MDAKPQGPRFPLVSDRMEADYRAIVGILTLVLAALLPLALVGYWHLCGQIGIRRPGMFLFMALFCVACVWLCRSNDKLCQRRPGREPGHTKGTDEKGSDIDRAAGRRWH